MVFIKTTSGQPSIESFSLIDMLQNRRALLLGNRSQDSNFVPGINQSQNTEFLFPDNSIGANKVNINIPKQYDAVATKDHVSGTTLIRYDGSIFYSIASVVDYAITKNKASFSLFLEEGTYNETRTIGDGTISLSIVGASKLNSIISVKGLPGFFGGILDLGDDSLVNNLSLDVNEGVSFFIGSTNTFSRSVISNCLFVYSNSTFASIFILLKGSNIVIQGNSFTSTVSFPVAPGVAPGLIQSYRSDTISAITINENSFNSNSHRSIFLEASTSIKSVLINNNTAQTQGYSFAVINYSGTATNSIIFIKENTISNSSVVNSTAVSINGFSDSTNLFVVSGNLLENGRIIFQNIIEGVITGNKIFNTISGLIAISINGTGLSFYVESNFIEVNLAHAVQTGNCVNIYFCNNRVKTAQSFNCIHSPNSTFSFSTFNGNQYSITGTGTSSFLNVLSIVDSNISNNIAQVRTSGTTGRLITATTANTNIITSNRVIAGGGTFLSFATGTNIVANNLST